MNKILKIIRIKSEDKFGALFYMLFSIFIASIAVGINVIAFPSILIENKISPFLIAMTSTNEIIFGVIGSILVTRIVKKISVATTVSIISAIYGVIIFYIFFYQNYPLWLLLSGMAGACWVSLYVIRQAWINNLISNKNRSMILALTTTIFCAGFISGSFIVNHFGALNHESFMASTGLVLFSALLMVLVKSTQPNSVESEIITFVEFIKKLPNESLARFLLDLQVGVVVCLGVVFGTRIGLTTEDAGLLLAGFMASGLFDLYAGILVKKFDRRKMINLGFFGCLAAISAIIIFYENYNFLWLGFLFLGSFCALIIIATLTIVNESFGESQLVAANGTFQAIGSIGSFLGCLLGGIAIQIFDFYGFFAVIIFANLSYFLCRFVKFFR